jgi:hypothetical protein
MEISTGTTSAKPSQPSGIVYVLANPAVPRLGIIREKTLGNNII